MLRVLFMGTPAFACPVLEAVHRAGHEVVGVVTQPDRPAGRRGQLAPPPVKVLARSLGLRVLQPTRVRRPEVVRELAELRPDVTLTAAFGQILSPAVLAVPRLGSLNVHASLLPRYRGAAPIARAIMAGEAETGVTIMWMDEGMDTGDLLCWRAVPIHPDDTAGTLHDRLAALGAELAVEALRLVEEGRAPRIPQDHALATYAPKLTREDERIDWSEPAARVRDRVRALSPFPGAYTESPAGMLKVWAVELVPGAGGAPPGMVVATPRGGAPVVACGEGAVALTEVQPEGRRRMSGQALVAGYRLRPGDRLGTVSPGPNPDGTPRDH